MSVVKMAADMLSIEDPTSFSRPDLAKVTNMYIDLKVNFFKKCFNGIVNLIVVKVDESVNEIILDSKGLAISNVMETSLNIRLKYTLSDPVGELGSRLCVELPPKAENKFIISIKYDTDPNASGLLWVETQQTLGKRNPIVFSQFQGIHARSVIPCQDTPNNKVTYKAQIMAPKDLQVIMSAKRDGEKILHGSKLNYFFQDVAVPTYGIAIAIGDFYSKRVGPRSLVWAEKEILDDAAADLTETETQLATAESICGPYVWGPYDVLILPPSFPYGAMENPCVTFCTPTSLTGDKSLMYGIGHEIAHSWTGNLVTNRNFEHFWLNEGLTTFIERRIIRKLGDEKVEDFHAFCGFTELEEEVNFLGSHNQLTKLVIDIKGCLNPDDTYSKIPYEKGYVFLRYLENVVGGPDIFEPFIKAYCEEFKNKSIVTDDFKSFFESHFAGNHNLDNIDWDVWLYTPGMPPVIPDYDMTIYEMCSSIKKRWLEWNENIEDVKIEKEEVEQLDPLQTIQILQEIMNEPPQSVNKLQVMQVLFKFNQTNNMEIKYRWLRICVKAKWLAQLDEAFAFVNSIGRMKFIRPLYRELYAWEEVRSKVVDNFLTNSSFMIHITRYLVAKDLHLTE